MIILNSQFEIVVPIYKRSVHFAGFLHNLLTVVPIDVRPDLRLVVCGSPNDVAAYRCMAMAHNFPGYGDKAGQIKLGGFWTHATSIGARANAFYRYGRRCKTFMMVGDDGRPQPGFVEGILRHVAENPARLFGVRDVTQRPDQKLFTTAPVFTEAYVEQFGGTIDGVHPTGSESYLHGYLDVEMCATALARGAFCFMDDVVVDQLGPGEAPPKDPSYARRDLVSQEGYQVLCARAHLFQFAPFLPR